MQLIQKYQKELLLSFTVFVVFSVAGIAYELYLSTQKTQTYVQQMELDNSQLLRTAIHGLNREADTIFAIKVNQPAVLEMMSQASNPKKRDKIRQKFYQLLQPTYELLKQNGIRQFHFHLPGNISFLRFHKPEKYGDSLKGIRYSIDQVNKTKKIIRGFEEGRIFNGFRNVYPLFFHKKFIGTVEISFSIRAIAQTLSQRDEAFYGLLIKKSIVQKKVWKENQKYYLQSKIDTNFLWDKKAFNTLYIRKNSSQFLRKLRSVEEILHKQIQNHLEEKQNILLHFKYNKEGFIAIFHPLHNIAGKIVGYIVSFQKSNFFAQTKKHQDMNFILVFVLNFILGVLFFFFLKNEHDIKEMLLKRSNYDPLTNLLNRRGFEVTYKALFQAHKREQKTFSLLFLDIDHFKHINDTYGHDVGDLVLEELAKILKNTLRESDIIARWGGEEFVILLNDISDVNKAKKVAEKLRTTIENSHMKNLPPFTVSIGVAHGTIGKSFDILIKEADEALYRAKENGRNQVQIK